MIEVKPIYYIRKELLELIEKYGWKKYFDKKYNNNDINICNKKDISKLVPYSNFKIPGYMVEEWLRYEYNLIVKIYGETSGFYWEINDYNNSHILDSNMYYKSTLLNTNMKGMYDGYDICFEEAVKYALKFIDKIH